MKSESTINWWLPPTGLRFCILILLILGIFFRFVNLDRKPYWFDETFTSLRVAGYTETQMKQQILDGRVVSIQELKRYQSLDADSSLINTVVSLAKEEPQFPPLYFVLVRFWVQWFGNSVAVTRSISAFIGLLAFPCIYWLCLELFKSPLTGWIAMALIAISPFHVLYAQEARPYSLWTVTILLSSATLLRAIRLQTKLSWVTYAVTLVLGLYTYLYFALVAIGHAVYAIATEDFRWSKTTVSYGLALLAAALIFGFWPLAVIVNRPSLHNVSGFWYNSATRQHLLNRWATSFTRVFIDFGSGFPHSFRELLPLVPFILSGLLLVGYAVYLLYRQTPKRVWLFVLTLIGSQLLFLMLPDLILGRWRLSGETRYLIPCYLGIELAVAYLLSTKITSIYPKLWQQKLWQLATGLVLLAGVVSCTMSSQAQVWWNKGYSQDDPDVAKIVNNAKQPLLIGDDSPNAVISLSYLLNPNVSFQLVARPSIPKISKKFSEVFLYRASDTLRSRVEQEQSYTVKPASKNHKIVLWRLIKQ
ncbi:MAG TPA: glycosyltransferase family 39 protein [Chroococcales cyanobacterium]